jgi:hypothetical protein
MPSSAGSSSLKAAQNPEDEGTTVFKMTGNYSPRIQHHTPEDLHHLNSLSLDNNTCLDQGKWL